MQFTERIKFIFLIRTLLVLNYMQQCGKEIMGEMVYEPMLMLSNNHNRQDAAEGETAQISISSL